MSTEINFDQHFQLTSLWLCGKAKKKNAIHWYKSYIWRLCRNRKVWANLEVNSWRLMVNIPHWFIFQINHLIEKNWWWAMITNGLKSSKDLYLEAKNQNMMPLLIERVNKYRLCVKTKLWITPALQKPIFVKNLLLQEFINCNNPSRKEHLDIKNMN